MKRSLVLTEDAQAPVKKENGRWLVTVATPGQGSSGYYSEELLSEQGPLALQSGAQSFINHDSTRSPKDMIGVFPEGAFWNKESKKLQAELEVFPHWKEFVETVGPHSGMSLYMHGESDDEGNVTKLIPHAHNGCDLVARPGLEGSGLDEKLYESLRAEAQAKAKAEETQDMELEQKVDALADKLDQLIASQEPKKEGDEPSPEDLVAEALNSYQEAIVEIDKAELLPSQVADLRERAKEGKDVAPLIESAKAINEELKAQFEEAQKANDEGVGNVLGGVKVESATELGKVFG